MFKNKERTAIAELGEFGLIKHLTSNFKIQHETSTKGIGAVSYTHLDVYKRQCNTRSYY